MMLPTGLFLISLDFELCWGKVTGDRDVSIAATRDAIIRMLDVFSRRGIRTTWATVGLIFCENADDALSLVDEIDRPKFASNRFSNYEKLCDSRDGFAPELIRQIRDTPGQEVASHTFSHLCCLEDGLTADQFRADLQAARNVAHRYDIKLTSIVFPRNQYSSEHAQICGDLGFTSYRGNPDHRFLRAEKTGDEKMTTRFGRLIDSYLPIAGNHAYRLQQFNGDGPIDIPQSRFLRPCSKSRGLGEKIRLRRILVEMTEAANQNKVYHLWWHPHNFSENTEANFAFLDKILRHFERLNQSVGFRSANMQDVVSMLTGKMTTLA